MITVKDIQRFRSQIGKTDEGYYYNGDIICFCSDLLIASARVKNEKLIQINNYQKYILQDLWNLGAIIYKLEWMRLQLGTDDNSESLWYQFATVDIENFYVEFRSIFDYIAEIVKVVANKPGQIKNTFNMQEWLKNNPGHRNALGEELANLVESVDWFPAIKEPRDLIIHCGGFTLPFWEHKKGILFQVYGESLKPFVKDEIVMYNQNVVDFQLYSALYLCKLFLFLDEFSKTIRIKLNIPKTNSAAKLYSLGFDLLMQWLDKLTDKIKPL